MKRISFIVASIIKCFVFTFVFFHTAGMQAQNTTANKEKIKLSEQLPAAIKSFELKDVMLLESPFKNAEQVDLRYIMALDPDRLLSPYLREAGLQPKAKSYENWENTGLDGHIGGHYLSALSMMYASTGNKKVLDRLNYMVSELKRCQDKNGNGYIGGIPGGLAMWSDIAQGKIDAGSFSLNKKWVPWYNLHKLFAGLRDAYQVAGNEHAKEMLIKLAKWSVELVKGLDEKQIQQMLRAEQGGMNEVFADVAAITCDTQYLDLARKFSDKVILDPLLHDQDKLNGMHANTQIPKVIGFKRIADLSGDETWDRAAQFFWETVVDHRTAAIGGNSVSEHFNPTNNFSSMISSPEGPETCNTYNMLRLSKMLYQTSGSVKYIDYYERALYNHILSTQHPVHGGFVYFTPMRPRHYRVYSQPQTSFWCCVGSGMENHAKYGELIYAHSGNDLFVNLFIPSKLNWKEKNVSLTQQTKFPDQESTSIVINAKKPTPFTLKLRYPVWLAKNKLQVFINGKEQKIQADPGSYVSINRTWKQGDKIIVKLPMQTTLEDLPDHSGYVAILHGPIVLAAKTDTTDLQGLLADNGRMGHVARGKLYPLQDAPLLVSEKSSALSKITAVKGMPLTFQAPGLFYPAKYKDIKLIPFFRLYDARYMIYWQQASPEELAKIQQKNSESEKLQLQLRELTIDQVSPGEQQPESDHFFQGDQSQTGINKDRHWRDARVWFSYDLKDKNKEATILQVTYYGLDKGRNFDILVNDTKIATVNLDGTQGDKFYTIDYPIPVEVLQKEKDNLLVTKFKAHQGSVAGGIYEVRLLKK